MELCSLRTLSLFLPIKTGRLDYGGYRCARKINHLKCGTLDVNEFLIIQNTLTFIKRSAPEHHHFPFFIHSLC